REDADKTQRVAGALQARRTESNTKRRAAARPLPPASAARYWGPPRRPARWRGCPAPPPSMPVRARSAPRPPVCHERACHDAPESSLCTPCNGIVSRDRHWDGGSRTQGLGIIVFPRKPGTMPLFHTDVRGYCHGVAPVFLPARPDRTRMAVLPAALCLAE